MPNHVLNVIKMDGISKLPLFSLDSNNMPMFDFNKVIPMPESLNIESSTSQELAVEMVLRKLSHNISSDGFTEDGVQLDISKDPIRYLRSNLRNKIYSRMTHEEFTKQRELCKRRTDEELIELGLKVIQNCALYGQTDWYEWSWDHWGTKWNSYDNDRIDSDTIAFSTAWSAPEPILEALMKMYPQAVIQHWWCEEFIGSGNSGCATYMNGRAYVAYDHPMSYDCLAHEDVCYGHENLHHCDPGNVLYQLGDGNVIYQMGRYYRNPFGNVLYHLEDRISTEDLKMYYESEDKED